MAPVPPADEWAEDIKSIAVAGYTHIQFRPQWAWHERIRGTYTWDDLDELFDLAYENRIRVVLKPMLETTPNWVFAELEGARIGFGGIPIGPFNHPGYYVGGWMPCFDNPAVRRSASDFICQLVNRYHRHPALWYYDAWNEPRSRPLGQCQCLHSIASYRKWLESHFGNIEQLNVFLGKAYTSYDMLRPPQNSWDYIEMYLWRQWAAYAVSEHVRFASDAIHNTDPNARVIAHVGCCSVFQDPACDASDDMLNAKTVDRYGTSFPINLDPSTPIEHANPDYISDWLRRVDPLYWCHEFYPNGADWCRPPQNDVLNRLIWMAISGGASAFTFWEYKSTRQGGNAGTNGWGLREIDGSQTERGLVADKIAAALKKHGSKLAGTTRIPSKIALLYNRESDLLARVQEMTGGWNNSNHENESTSYYYKRAIKAAHAIYLACGKTVDWVIPKDDLSNVSLLHVTASEMIDADAADWLKDYVHKGGCLVVEYPFACRDSNIWVSKHRPNHTLDDLTGCRETRRMVESNNIADIAKFQDNITITARRWRIDLMPLGGEIIATWQDGAVAAVKHSYGKGTVYTLGVNVSLGFSDTFDDPAINLFTYLIDEAKIVPDFIQEKGLWVRRRIGNDREIWFVFNISDSINKLELPCKPVEIWQGPDIATNLSLQLLPGETWVSEMPLRTG
ncbi:MAG: beta-galactosidase [Armatimonadota bacterium]